MSLFGPTPFGPSTLQRAAQSQAARAQQLQHLYQQQMQTLQGQNTPMANPYLTATGPTPSNTWTITNSTATTPRIYTWAGTNITTTGIGWIDDDEPQPIAYDPRKLTIHDGTEKHIHLPDGTVIEIAKDGSFVIKDENAKVTYRANRVREFNPFLNASDKLEEFIRFCGAHGARKGEALDIPIRLFIGWLIVEAAKADQEPEPDVLLLPDLRKQVAQPRCVSCGRFIPRIARQRKIEFCGTPCFDRQMLKLAA